MKLLKITKSNLQVIQNKFSAAENFKKSSYNQRVNLWEKGENARLYVPRNAYEQAGYINLISGEVYATRPGNTSTLEEVRDFITQLDTPDPDPEPEVVREATEPEAKAELTAQAEAIREHVKWFSDNRGNWWESRFPLMLRKRLIKDGLIPSAIGDMPKEYAIAAINAELRASGLDSLCSK